MREARAASGHAAAAPRDGSRVSPCYLVPIATMDVRYFGLSLNVAARPRWEKGDKQQSWGASR
jgi:hypothetical protein